MEVKLFLFKGNTILYIEKSKESIRKVIELINSAKLQDIKSTHKNKLYFYTPAMSNMKRKFNQDDVTLVH